MNMWKMTNFRRKRRGFALIFVVLIAVAMIIPAMILASNAVSRRKVVTGESISDRVLTVADGSIDMIVAKINKFPKIVDPDNNPFIKTGLDNISKYYTDNPPDDSFVIKRDAVYFTMGYLLSVLNGGQINQPTDSDNPENLLQSNVDTYPGPDSITEGSFWDIEDNISTYLYNMKEQTYYAVWNTTNDKIANVEKTGLNGDILSKPIKNLSTGEVKTGIARWDSNYIKDRNWVEIDTNTQYIDDGKNEDESTKFQIRVSAYPLIKGDIGKIQRNILSEVTLKSIQVNTSSSGGSGSSGSGDVGPFHYAVWSGKGFILNGVHKIQSGHVDPTTNRIVYDGKTGHGDVYADGEIIMNGNNRIYGDIATSEDHIISNGLLDMGRGHKIIYNRKETLPDFDPGTENDVKTTALSNGTPHPGNFVYSGWGNTLNVNGGEVSYYIGGDVSINGGGNTIKFYPVSNTNPDGPAVDWYVDGDMSFNGDTVFDFGDTPGIIWVNGSVTFNGNVTIKGSGTIVANKSVTFNGFTRADTSDPNSKLAIVSEGEDSDGGIILNGNNTMKGIFYAPHSDIILNGTGDVFGSLVAGGYVRSSVDGVIVNGNQDITYDTGIESDGGSGNPPLPSNSSVSIEGVAFSATYVYRLSWREIIADPVNTKNIENLTPEFKYNAPSGS
jgi:hypothetical protein